MGVRVGVGNSATLVLAGHATTFQSTTRHNMALGMFTVCKAALPSHATPACCHMPMPRSCKAPLSTSPPYVFMARHVCVHSVVPDRNLLLLQL